MPQMDKFMEIYRNCCTDSKTRLKVKTVGQDRCLDVNADRLEAQDWQPLLKALKSDRRLHTLSIKSEYFVNKRKSPSDQLKPAVYKQGILDDLIDSVTGSMKRSNILSTVHLQALPLAKCHVDKLAIAVKECTSLQNLLLTHFRLNDDGIQTLYMSVCPHIGLHTIDFTGCLLTTKGALTIAKIIKTQRITRFDETWKQSLRYRVPDQELFPGIRRITLNENPQIGDVGCMAILHELMDDLWVKALDMQNCGLTEISGKESVNLLKVNETIMILDVNRNDKVTSQTKIDIKELLNVRRRNDNVSKSGKEMNGDFSEHCNRLEGAKRDLRSRNPNSEFMKPTGCKRPAIASSSGSTSHLAELRETKKMLSETKRDLIKEREKREELEKQKIAEKILLAEKFNKEWSKRKQLEKERDKLKKELHVCKSEGRQHPHASKTKSVKSLKLNRTLSRKKVKKNQENKRKHVGQDESEVGYKTVQIAKNDLESHTNCTQVSSSKPVEPADKNTDQNSQTCGKEVNNFQQVHLMQKNLDKLNLDTRNVQLTPTQSTSFQSTPSEPTSLQLTPSQSTPSQQTPFQSTPSQSSPPRWTPMDTDTEITCNVHDPNNANKRVKHEEPLICHNTTRSVVERKPRDLSPTSRSQWIFNKIILGKSITQESSSDGSRNAKCFRMETTTKWDIKV